MKLDILPFESWESLNRTVQSQLAIDSEFQVRSYLGLSRAVSELAFSTAQFYSHKRSLAIIQGNTPHFKAVLPYFYKEGYEVQEAPKKFEVKEWVESLKKDTCLVLLAEDHAVTGEKNNFLELETVLNEKKIFTIIISHHSHLYDQLRPQPYTVRIHSFSPTASIAVLGNKFKAPPIISNYSYWDQQNFLQQVQIVTKKSGENKSLVKVFESSLPEGFKALFPNSFENRIFDRALFYSESIGGEAIQQFISAKLGLGLQPAGFELEIETTHLCRWGATLSYYDWWADCPKEDILRGMNIFSLEIIKQPQIQDLLKVALQECTISEF